MNQELNQLLFLLPYDHQAEIHAGRLYLHLYNELFYVFDFTEKVEKDSLIECLKENVPNMEIIHKIDFRKDENEKTKIKNENSIIKLKENVLLELTSYTARIIYGKNQEIQPFVDLIVPYIIKKKGNSRFNLIVSSNHSESGLDIEEFDVKNLEIEIADHYNDDFVNVNTSITEFLNENNKSGLVLLHGKQGTGKTTYIRYLISTINKKFIYIPAQMVQELSNPRFLPFITEFRDSILIIEDCEDILKSRDSTQNSTNALSNLLNMGDGLLSDALCLKILCTFNTELKNIDKAILRKGRLHSQYEFKELSENKVINLLKKLNISDCQPKSMTLAEIYTKSTTTNNSILQLSKKIGFRNNDIF